MAIKKFENKSLSPDKGMTENGKSAIIETKEEAYYFPSKNKTIMARSMKEAKEKANNL